MPGPKQTSRQREYVESVEGAAKPAGKRINAAWHQQNPMPARPTLEQRIAWHKQHMARCGCRPVPAKLRALLDA